MLLSSGEAVLLARGQTRLLALSQVAKLVAVPGLLYFGYVRGGLQGLVVGFVAAEILRYVLIASAVARLGLPFYRDDLLFTVLIFDCTSLVLWAGPGLWGGQSAWVRLACASAALLLFWGVVFAVAWRQRWITVKITNDGMTNDQ
jgi:uncharacterized integral membrane protein